MDQSTLKSISRRAFLKSSAALGAFTILPSYVALGNRSSAGIGPNDKVNLAIIGVGNRGFDVTRALYGTGLCNVVALCDVDMEGKHTHASRYIFGVTDTPPAVKKGEQLPKRAPHKARGFTDFRKMFDSMADEIDAVLIATPDHAHFCATMLAMSLGKHVYVEKPLAHTFGQSERLIRMAAKHPNVVTQMGNQGHSGANYFQFKAYTEAGLMKGVERVTGHMNLGRRWYGWDVNTKEYPSQPAPNDLDWDQWRDAVAEVNPYSNQLHPGNWRGWYNYGSGCFGDWGPHCLDTPHRFLELGLPTKVSAVQQSGVNPHQLIYPKASTVEFDFAARSADLPACKVTWYEGSDNQPYLEGEYTDDGKPEKLKTPGKVIYTKDLVFKGGHHGEPLQVVPRAKYMDIRSSLPRFPQKNSNHHTNFLLACKGEEESRSPFSVSGPLSQVFNLGMIAQRLNGSITFDPKLKQITSSSAANALIDPVPRKGWEQFYYL
ncbi:Gfo/Idh/MocA family oxidoreductase [Coraliomargarita sp. W4R53]